MSLPLTLLHGSLKSPSSTSTTLLLDDPAIPAAFFAWELRQLKSTATNCVTVQRAVDNATAVIGFTGGAVNSPAIATFCGSSDGHVRVWHDQSGNGRDLTARTTTSVAGMPRIYIGSSGTFENLQSRILIRAIGLDDALETAAFTTYAGTQFTVSLVGAITSTVSTLQPRMFSMYGASNTDSSDSQGFTIVRNGSGTPTAQWNIGRSTLTRASQTGAYSTLAHVDALISDPSYTVAVNGSAGTTGSAPLGAMAATRATIGWSGNAASSDGYWGGVIGWSSALNSTQLEAVRTHRTTIWATPAPSPTPNPDPDPTPDPDELARPFYAGSTLNAQTHFGITGGYNLAHFGGPAGNFPWSMNTTHPPSGAYYGPTSSKVTIVNAGQPGGYLRGYFDENGLDQPITVTCNQGHQHQVFRNGHYFAWNGPGNGAVRRGGVWRYKMRYPTKFVGMGHVPLLWPTTEDWPGDGEVDITENYTGGTDWNTTEVNIHYSDNNRTARRTFNQRNIVVPGGMQTDHIYAVAWHPGTDAAGTGAYIRGYIDDVLVYRVEWNGTYNDVRGAGLRPGTEFIMHGDSAVNMNLRLQVEAYNRTDADYNGGFQPFRFYWFQHWSLP